ncbi:hypothetical protein MY3296_003257 [Beauveria thailandica]
MAAAAAPRPDGSIDDEMFKAAQSDSFGVVILIKVSAEDDDE